MCVRETRFETIKEEIPTLTHVSNWDHLFLTSHQSLRHDFIRGWITHWTVKFFYLIFDIVSHLCGATVLFSRCTCPIFLTMSVGSRKRIFWKFKIVLLNSLSLSENSKHQRRPLSFVVGNILMQHPNPFQQCCQLFIIKFLINFSRIIFAKLQICLQECTPVATGCTLQKLVESSQDFLSMSSSSGKFRKFLYHFDGVSSGWELRVRESKLWVSAALNRGRTNSHFIHFALDSWLMLQHLH